MQISNRLKHALGALREGRPIILLDKDDRENEADLIFAAEKTTPELINFMIQYTSGIICLCITEQWRQKLQLPFMVQHNENSFQTAFTVSIEAREGVSTGVSAADRAHTILTAINDNVSPHEIVMPGHMFPLVAKEGGLEVRQGHTEGSIALCSLAKLKPAAVLAELMNPDGTMMRPQEAQAFATLHNTAIVTMEELLEAYHAFPSA